ncbi:Lin0512 family protein [Halobacillus sp. H74]|uniref:Lin0512 family protein n=1 Tax=Halobacillus sp. H74 TaxID=3457436 RepID=UPI003FCDD756
MKEIIFIQTGTGIDVHGQNVTKASVRAVENAIHSNSMPGIQQALPDESLDNMKTHVKLAIPCDHDELNHKKIKEAVPYGDVEIKLVDGGMRTTSGVVLNEEDDHNDQMYIVNASIEVGY